MMKTKAVYVLVCSSADYYAEQLWVSILSLRYHNPDITVEIVCDRESANQIVSAPVHLLADTITVVDFCKGITAIERSRRIKTDLRKLVSGDFIYMDTDTIITSSLADVDELEGSLYAVADAHCKFRYNPYKEMICHNASLFGYDARFEENFFNGGVVYAKDDRIAADFYAKWNALYLEGVKKGISIDQPSFAKANKDLGHPMRELPGSWNCQLKHGVRFLHEARIVHYLWTAKRAPSPFVLGREDVWKQIRNFGEIPEDVKKLFDDPWSGIQDLTYLASTEETILLNSRAYKVVGKLNKEAPGLYSILNFWIRALDIVYKRTHN